MSKVICDVCGTTFPETANQCPICGSAKNASAQTAAEGGVQAEAGSTNSYVSGGRFSKSNVRKRNKTGQPMQRTAKKDNDGGGSNKGLVIVVIVLLLAIIAVVAYLAITLFGSDKKPDEGNKTPSVQTTVQTQPKEEDPTESQTQPTGIACTDIVLSSTIIEFTDAERSQLLSVNLTPSNTTDKVTFTSLNTAVATVTDGGLVTPVGIGDTTILITCGNVTKECRVFCNFGNTSTEPDPTTPTEPDVTPDPGAFEMTMNTKYFTHDGIGDVTLTVGKTWRMYATMNVEASKVVWTSDDEAYVTIKDGVVTTVASTESLAKKYVLVHAEYGGVKYSCRIRVNSGTSTTPTTPPATEPTTPPVNPGAFEMTFNTVFFTPNGEGEVSLNPGDSWKVYKTISVSPEQASWVSENPDVCTVANGVVTAVATGKTMVHVEYNGVRYSCVIHVR
ncbi:MAG: Ig-like domain-containing protein [Oscillospiraceae bacterium]|nr:Ig-like domain-containing protein [Oscillospiraceae bacterium]